MSILKNFVGVLIHPVSTFNMIKENRDKFPYWKIIFIYLLLIPSSIAGLYINHFPFKNTTQNVNILLQVSIIFFPLFTYIIVNFAVESLMAGETLIKEITYTTGLCMAPFIIFMVIIPIVTNLFCLNEAGFIAALYSFTYVWIILLIFICIKVMNGYGFKETIKAMFFIIIGMAILWGVLLFLVSLGSHLMNFINEVILEIKYRSIG